MTSHYRQVEAVCEFKTPIVKRSLSLAMFILTSNEQYHFKNSPVVTLLSYNDVSPVATLLTLLIILTSI